MGLVKAALGAASSVMGDQWKEYFTCSALPADVLAVKGEKKQSGRSANRHGSENIITDGSIVAVAEGQCALIVEQGKVVDLCAEPGEYTYNTGTQPSLLSGGLAKNIDDIFAEMGKRFAFGGQEATDQRIYYINTKELPGNKYGTPSPVPSRVVASGPASTWTSASGALASTATASPTPSCFTPMSAAMWKTPISVRRWTASSRPSC